MADVNEKINELTNMQDNTAEFEQEDIQKNKVMGIFAYLSWLVLIPLFAAKDSKFARFHCNQGLVLAIVEIVTWVVFGILSNIPYVGWLFAVLNSLISIVCVVFAVLGIVSAARGQAKQLPIIGKIKILK